MHCHVELPCQASHVFRHGIAFPNQVSRNKLESGPIANRHFAERKRGAGQLSSSNVVPHALVEKKCVPCEADGGALEAMGLCESLSRREAENLLGQVLLLFSATSSSW